MKAKRKIQKRTGACFMCKREGAPEIYENPAEGSLATGTRLDYGDTYAGGKHAGEYKRIVFRGYICDMHASGDDIISIRYL